MVIFQVPDMNKSNKTSNQPMDLNKTTERGINIRPSSIWSPIYYFCLCGLAIINVAITVYMTLLHVSRSKGFITKT